MPREVLTVGRLRQQTALCESDTPVEFSLPNELQDIATRKGLIVAGCYYDSGTPLLSSRCFKIVVQPKEGPNVPKLQHREVSGV